MSYRPITDFWILARAKLKGGEKFYGAWPGGFPERARALLGVSIDDPVLHVCGGKTKLYPYPRAFGPNDATLDLDASLNPDFCMDAREEYPKSNTRHIAGGVTRQIAFKAVLADPPYSVDDASKYVPGAKAYPTPNRIVKNAIDMLPVGGRVGILHYIVPSPPKNAKFVACVAVMVGYNNRIRAYSVFERLE